MKKNLFAAIVFVMACAAPVVLLNCGEDTAPGGGNDAGGGGGGGGGGDGGVTIEDAGQGQPTSLSGTVIDHQTKQPVADARVEILDDETGEPLAGFEGKSGTDGFVKIEGIPAKHLNVGVRVSKADCMDTLQYHYPAGSQNETFRLLSETTVSLIAGILGVTLDPAKGVAAGSIYWGDSTDETPIGCASVVTDPAGSETHYMDNSGIPTKSRDALGTNPVNGYFAILNMEPGEITINATAGAATGSVLLPKLYPDSVAIANVYFGKTDYPANPQAGGCQ